MTKKHFEAIAKIIRQNHPGSDNAWLPSPTVWNDLISDLADLCADENPRFSRWRFILACRPDPNEEE